MSRRLRRIAALGSVALGLLVVPLAGADPPTVSITGAPPSLTGSDAASISFDVAGTADSVECSLSGGGGGGPVSCGSPASYSSLSDGAHTFTVTVTNADGPNSDSTSWTVDTTGPTLSLSNVTRSVDDVSSATVNYTPGGSDPHGPVSFDCSPASGSSFPLGQTTVSCTAQDSLGNQSGPGTFTVNVQDTTAPSVTPPANVTASVNGVASSTVSYGAATASGGFSTSCLPASGSTFPLGATTVTCSATDGSGNTGSATFTVTVSDTTAPNLVVPANITRESALGSSQSVTYAASATDGPATVTPACTPASGSTFSLGTTHVGCTATDAAGNTATDGFDVVVRDTTAPNVTIGSGPSGTITATDASFGFSANEGATTCSLDGGGFGPCSSPKSYSGLASGPHTFTVKATDGSSNAGTASRSWTVDNAPPTFTAPTALVVEANAPDGAVVTYSVTAADDGVPLLPSAVACSPASGTKFPIKITTVTCNATDSLGNTGSTSFPVTVRDSTPPRIVAADITVAATSQAGVRKTDPPLSQYLNGLRASDLVSSLVLVTNDAPDLLPVGKTSVRLVATDGAGNGGRRTIVVTVLPLGQVAPPPPDVTPPADVTRLAALPGDHTVKVSWTPPDVKDLASIEVRMGDASGLGPERIVSRGIRTSVTVIGLTNGTEYRFVAVTIDTSGNESRGAVVLAIPEARLLVSPKAGTRVTTPPLLRWAPAPNATYYNVQIFRGKLKVLSAWPTRAQLKLTKSWTYAKVKRKLALGTYTWYVWPGFGKRADVKYGKLRGKSSFVVVKPPKPVNPA